MVTTRIRIKNHVCEYVRGKWGALDERSPVRFPPHADIYYLIWDNLVKRPLGCVHEEGNLEIVLPARHGSKPPAYYNYLGRDAQKAIGRRLEQMMWAEYRQFVETERYRGVLFMAATEEFISRYCIESLSEEAFRKSYYRWRCKCYGRQKQAI